MQETFLSRERVGFLVKFVRMNLFSLGIVFLFILMPVNASLEDAANAALTANALIMAVGEVHYSWMDGTTAPMECVALCRANGINVDEKIENRIAYLSDGCKEVCYGSSAATATSSGSAGSTGATASGGAGTTASGSGSSSGGNANANQNVNVNKVSGNATSSGGGTNAQPVRAQNATNASVNATAMNQTAYKEQVKEKVRSMKEIQNYFKEQVKNITENAEPGERGQEISALRHEVNAIISEYVKNNTEFNLSDVMPVEDERVNITSDSIASESFQVNASQKRIKARVRMRMMMIAQENGSLVMEGSTGVKARVREVAIANNSFIVEGKELKLLPSEAAAKVKWQVKEMEIVQNQNRLSYKTKVNVKAKILWLFDTEYDKDVYIDADNGEVFEEQNAPWWAFLAFE
ncbi:MAG: hypothetical protein ABIH83_00525 [Candidatus Micrarchaeota archaeon]